MLLVTVFFVGCATTTGVNTDLIGPGKNKTVIYMDVNALYEKQWTDNLYYQNTWTLFFLLNEANRVGTGLKWGLRYHLYKGLSIYGRGGFSVIPDGGDIDKLAHSCLYGNLDFGFVYKNWSLGLEHISSPAHHAEDGDTGLNFIKLEYRF